MKYKLILAFVIVLLMTGFVSAPAPHVEVFEISSGHTCVTDYRDGNAYTQCFCPCGEEFELIKVEEENES